jgi:hypothetical protein
MRRIEEALVCCAQRHVAARTAERGWQQRTQSRDDSDGDRSTVPNSNSGSHSDDRPVGRPRARQHESAWYV